MAKWLPPHGFTGNVHQMDAKVGGTYKMSFTNFRTGKTHSFGGKYLELVRTSASATPTLRRPESARRNAHDGRPQEGLRRDRVQHRAGRHPGVIPAEACYLGWQESLTTLAQLVEPEIPG